jgi:hypothetical protein
MDQSKKSKNTVGNSIVSQVFDASLFCHAYNSESTSSKRTAVVKNNFFKKINYYETQGLYVLDGCSKKNLRKKLTKQKKKMHKISNLPLIAVRSGFNPDDMEKYFVLFQTFINDPVLQQLMATAVRTVLVSNVTNVLSVSNSINGSRLFGNSPYVPVCILVPRCEVLNKSPCVNDDVDCLERILQVHTKVSLRGMKKSGIATSYAILGATILRGGKGISFKHPVNEADLRHCYSMLNRMEHFAKMWLPFGLMSTLNESKNMCNDNATLLGNNCGTRGVWASIASSYNYVSPAHVDEDAFLSCMTVSFISDSCDRQIKHRYELEMEVALYFCLPQYGICVALRPGDIIFFNPLEYHCISQRTECYKNERIFVTSFYLKSKQLGLNDNNIPLENIFIDNLHS